MKQYKTLLDDILTNGTSRFDRTKTGTISVFGHMSRYDISETFPLLTTRKMHWNTVVHELLWFISGDTHIKYLHEHGVHIWDSWVKPDGDLGPIYGNQWRKWFDGEDEIDQLNLAIHQIKHDPYSRRILISAWNVGQLHEMALPPCHCVFQFYVDGDHLSCMLYQRSADAYLGVPYNIASYSLLTYMVAHVTGKKPKEFIHAIGDAHLYHNHIEQAEILLQMPDYDQPQVEVTGPKDIDSLTADDIRLIGYQHGPVMSAPVAV